MIVVLKSYRNVHFRNVNIYEISKGTPAEQWVKLDRIFVSENVRHHLSDYLRFMVLFKFGGVYFDTDFIIIKSLDKLPRNFAPQERTDLEYINSSVLGLEGKNVGHKIAEMMLRFVDFLRNANQFSHQLIHFSSIKWMFRKVCTVWMGLQWTTCCVASNSENLQQNQNGWSDATGKLFGLYCYAANGFLPIGTVLRGLWHRTRGAGKCFEETDEWNDRNPFVEQ